MHSINISVKNLILIVWIIFSIGYIGWDLWSDFKQNEIKQAIQIGRQEGQAATVNQLLEQAENKECNPFSVFKDKKQIQLINTACLQNSQPAKTPAPSKEK